MDCVIPNGPEKCQKSPPSLGQAPFFRECEYTGDVLGEFFSKIKLAKNRFRDPFPSALCVQRPLQQAFRLHRPGAL